MNEITDSVFWENYWKREDITPIQKTIFDSLLLNFSSNKSLLEVGGFPGRFAGYFKKQFELDVTILDRYINPDLILKMENLYRIPQYSIKYIKADFLNSKASSNSFDIVCSFGFIEHFEDTTMILEKHLEYLNSDGNLLIVLPNFLGVNGLVQWFFDRENLRAHNLKSMKIRNLKMICDSLELKNSKVDYIGHPSVWLEAKKTSNKAITSFIRLINAIIKRLPLQRTRLFAPYIYISGIKNTKPL